MGRRREKKTEKETQVLWLALFGDHSGKTHLAGNCIRVNTIYRAAAVCKAQSRIRSTKTDPSRPRGAHSEMKTPDMACKS